MTYLKVFTDFRELMEPLDHEEKGRLFEAMLAYAMDGVETALEGNERFIWPVARRTIDQEAAAYESKVEANRERARKLAGARERMPQACLRMPQAYLRIARMPKNKNRINIRIRNKKKINIRIILKSMCMNSPRRRTHTYRRERK